MSDLALPTRSRPELALGGRFLSDERLTRLVSKGSARAFAVLYQRHHQALYRYCRSIVRNQEDAQDALQSAMMRALEALQARERDLAVRPWLFRIVHNEAVSILRRRRPNVSLVEELEPADGGVERTLEKREQFAQLLADLQSLAERQRGALVMRELNGLSIEEIAAVLAISPGAAKQVLFEARCALQEFAVGRAMECEGVRRTISEGDGRVLRGRKIGAHLRECRGCRDFQLMIGARSADLRALAPPLPAAAATAMLARLLAHGTGGGHAGGAAAASSAALGSHAAAPLTVKALAGVVIVTAATAGTLHLASGSHGYKRVAPVARGDAPASCGATGKHLHVRIARRSSTTRQARTGLKAFHAGTAGTRSSTTRPARTGLKAFHAGTATGRQAPLAAAQRTRVGTSVPIAAQPAGPAPSRATAGGKASGGGRPAGGRGKHSAHRRSSSPQPRSPHAGHRYRAPKQVHPARPQQERTRSAGQTPAPAVEHTRGHEGPHAAAQAHPGTETHPSSKTAPAG